ncbi:unnamed protein product, partial [Ectocarpus sp. 12 AP-2014]
RPVNRGQPRGSFRDVRYSCKSRMAQLAETRRRTIIALQYQKMRRLRLREEEALRARYDDEADLEYYDSSSSERQRELAAVAAIGVTMGLPMTMGGNRSVEEFARLCAHDIPPAAEKAEDCCWLPSWSGAGRAAQLHTASRRAIPWCSPPPKVVYTAAEAALRSVIRRGVEKHELGSRSNVFTDIQCLSNRQPAHISHVNRFSRHARLPSSPFFSPAVYLARRTQ